MIHVREQIPGKPEGETRIKCGLTTLPLGDTTFFEGDPGAWLLANCEGCNPGGPKQLGTPISQLSGRLGHRGFDTFTDISVSWGFD